MQNKITVALISIILLFVFGCSQKPKETKHISDESHIPILKDSIFVSEFGGYGYDIFVDGKVKLHQPHIPSVAGIVGFSSAEEAKKIAKLVIKQMEHNHFPPIVTKQDLKDNGISTF
jgi:hypothetical protein